ncbi:DUF6573 family protein [Kribbella sp. NPDC026596]|uniref:DUF6573 family protein n=1 Tax=Kribbella sp. NPDC026596 TaxID=3155122 RepID=UPI00340A4F5C
MAKLFGEADVIHSYSRADSIAGGILIDVTETARESGFTVPVALTQEASLCQTAEARYGRISWRGTLLPAAGGRL